MEILRAAALRRKLYLIYALNVADWICTSVLLRAGGFYEANPLMRSVAGDASWSFLLKCIAPILLTAGLFRLIGRLDREGLMHVDRFISFVLVFYLALCLNHIANFVMLFLGAGA